MSLPRKADYLRRSLGELCAGNRQEIRSRPRPDHTIFIGPSIQTTMQGASRLQDTPFRSPSVRRSHQLKIRDPFQIAEIRLLVYLSILIFAVAAGRLLSN